MHWIDWLIVLIPLAVVGYIGYRVQRHVRAVSDFLTGGRVAGRYVVAVASGEAGMGLITVVAVLEMYYRSGFAIGFWSTMAAPIGLVVTLTGFAIYRYRETRVMTMAQFFEVRYSKRFRIFAGLLAWMSGVLNYAIFPAVGGRFLVYFCDLPETVSIAGWEVSSFALAMATFLGVAVMVVFVGGQLTTMVTDCVAGLLSYPMYAAVVIAILSIFSWDQMKDALLMRPPGESMLDPFDTGKLSEFNVLYIVVGIIGNAYNILSWQGTQAFNAAAASPHEQKMGMVLSTWRSGFSTLMIILLAVAAWTYMHHPDFASGAATVRETLAAKINLANDAATNQIREQMLVPLAIREFLPIGVLGAFCGVMVFLLISTDTSYLHSWGTILVQDVVLPLRKTPFTPAQQLWLLRLSIAAVATFAFVWSLYFNQVTYILMFFALTGAVYLGGAGAVIIGGLYWSRGTAAGAWAAMITGSLLAVIGFLLTQFWATAIYPWLSSGDALLPGLTRVVHTLSDLLPLVNWRVTPERFPISGQEIYLLTMLVATSAYVLVSLLTCRERFNLDRMLHRGAYVRLEDRLRAPQAAEAAPHNWKHLLLGFDDEFTRADKLLSLSVFAYSMALFAIWGVVVLWNVLIWRFTPAAWASYFWVMNVGLALLIGTVTSAWFTIGGTRDLRELFRRLESLRRNVLDDGRVIGHSNAEDLAIVPVRVAGPSHSPAEEDGRGVGPESIPRPPAIAAGEGT